MGWQKEDQAARMTGLGGHRERKKNLSVFRVNSYLIKYILITIIDYFFPPRLFLGSS